MTEFNYYYSGFHPKVGLGGGGGFEHTLRISGGVGGWGYSAKNVYDTIVQKQDD